MRKDKSTLTAKMILLIVCAPLLIGLVAIQTVWRLFFGLCQAADRKADKIFNTLFEDWR